VGRNRIIFPSPSEPQLRVFQLHVGCNWDFFSGSMCAITKIFLVACGLQSMWATTEIFPVAFGSQMSFFFSCMCAAIKIFLIACGSQVVFFSSCKCVVTEIFPVSCGSQLRFFPLHVDWIEIS
jgi:hypothetical protein